MAERQPQSPVANTVAQNVHRLRKAHGWTEAHLARLCHKEGGPALNRAILSNIETRRRRDISVDELAVLARVFDVRPEQLMRPITAPVPAWQCQQCGRTHNDLDDAQTCCL